MFGKRASIETRMKMSISRTGKIGENATGWKGGNNTLIRRIKGFQYRQGWHKRIYERDGYKCTRCGSKKQLEVHHILPMKLIVDDINKIQMLNTDDEKYLYAIGLDIITDNLLINGKTLCRECHKNIHLKMGSHNPAVKYE